MKQHGCGLAVAVGILTFGAALAPDDALGAEESCSPTRPDELQIIVAEAEDFLGQGAVRESLGSIALGISLIPCLTDSVNIEDLSSLYLVKGAALYRSGSKGRREAGAAFNAAFVYEKNLACDVPGLVSGARSLCVKEKEAVSKGILVAYDLTNHHSGALIYMDGHRVRPERRGLVEVNLPVGTHLLQVLSDDGFYNHILSVDSSNHQFDLVDILGPVPQLSKELVPGSIRLEGLPSDAAVVMDGRERRDLPVLTQLDPGEHYLKVNSPSQGVMGFTVLVEPGSQTVYAVIFDGAGGRGGGGGNTRAFASYGVAAALAAGAGTSFFLTSGRYSDADAAFDAYLLLEDSAAVSAQWDVATELQEEGNTFQTLGWGLSGAAVIAGAAGTFFLMRGDSGLADRGIRIIPTAGPSDGKATAGLLLSARF